MTMYILFIAIIVLVIYIKRDNIKKYLNKEISNIEELNQVDGEVHLFIQHYSAFNTEDLIIKMNSENLREVEIKAIKKVLHDRQAPTNTL